MIEALRNVNFEFDYERYRRGLGECVKAAKRKDWKPGLKHFKDKVVFETLVLTAIYAGVIVATAPMADRLFEWIHPLPFEGRYPASWHFPWTGLVASLCYGILQASDNMDICSAVARTIIVYRGYDSGIGLVGVAAGLAVIDRVYCQWLLHECSVFLWTARWNVKCAFERAHRELILERQTGLPLALQNMVQANDPTPSITLGDITIL